MKNISFTDIYYPITTDPRYKMLCALRMPLQSMLYHAKRYRIGERNFEWENLNSKYHELLGMVSAFHAMGMLENNDVFRIPFIAYRTALKIAYGESSLLWRN